MERAQLIEFKTNKKEILDISETAVKILKRDHNIGLSNAEALPTIVDAFLKSTVAWLSEHKSMDTDISIDVLGYFTMGVNYEEFETEGADKVGNFAPTIEAGEFFKLSAKDDELTEALKANSETEDSDEE